VEAPAVRHWRLAPFDQKHHTSGASRLAGDEQWPADTPPPGSNAAAGPLKTHSELVRPSSTVPCHTMIDFSYLI
jgi:hypothetical protein